MTDSPYPYEGPDELRQPILAALHRVVDPEVAMSIVDDACAELGRVVPQGLPVNVERVWEPAWTTDRMSDRAKAFMGW